MALTNLADLHRLQGRFDQAEALYKRSLAINERVLAPNDPDVVFNLNNLGEMASRRGRFAESDALYQRSQAILESALGSDDPKVAILLQNRAALYGEQGRYRDAEALAQRALAINEAKLGADHPDLANVIDNLAVVYQHTGRYAEAEQLSKRALAIRETALGLEHPSVAVSLNNLAELYRAQARYTEAEPLLRRSLAIREAVAGANHPDTANALNNLADFYVQRGRLDEAAAMHERALAILEAALGPDHPDVALGLNNLATVYWLQKRVADSERLQQRSLAINEKAFGPDHPRVAVSLSNVAFIDNTLGRTADAEALYRRSLAIREKALGSQHPLVVQVLDEQARFYQEHDRPAEAVAASRRAVAILGQRISEAPSQSATGAIGEQRESRSTFLLDVELVHATGGKDAVAETFRVGQLARASSAGRALAGMAVRFAAQNDALGGTVRDRQDLADRIERLDAAVVTAASRPPEQRDAAAEAALRAELAENTARLQALDKQIARDFPSYSELSRPSPVETDAVEADLRPDEAMLVYLVSREATWLWAVRHDGAQLFKLPVSALALVKEVVTLRTRLDPATNPDLLPFDATRAHELYQTIVAPAARALVGARHIFVVPDGPLESLPMSVLVTRRPERPLTSPADHRTVAWFIREHALTVLPSVGSLRALRHFAAETRAPRPFLGVGDPVLDGDPSDARGATRARLFRGGMADVDAVRKLPPLPETAGELRAVARALGASEQDLYLGGRASEPVL
ncbi:MAG: tetratricopeptide repeat protein, partial [Alphaproteobacteria bacterium]|nr:tetratricopeptide repeat protein [Alphaproteobacteria bacterium]